MQNIKMVFLGVVLTIALGACGGGHNHGHDHDHGSSATDSTHLKAHGEGKEFTSAYVCPMHCAGSGSDKEGKCPVCGMYYMALTEHIKNGHTH
jgi:hypothetical protein